MLHRKTIEPYALELLREIMGIDYFAPLKLVGGTSLALQIGHRKSIDLDFFGKLELSETDLHNCFKGFKAYSLLYKTPSIYVYTINTVKVDFVNYPYNWIGPEVVDGEIRLASRQDIAAMKLNAITGRGKKKDFYDLYYLLKEFTFEEMFDFYDQKYPDGNRFLVMRSITYFDDAEADQDPIVFDDVTWSEIKKTIQAKYYQYLKTT